MYKNAALLLILMPHFTSIDQDPEQTRALTELRKIGGTYELDSKSPDKPVLRIVLRGPKATDAALEHVKALPRLQELWLANTAITDAGLEALKDLKDLRMLDVYETGITDAGLDHVAGLTRLRQLNLGETK